MADNFSLGNNGKFGKIDFSKLRSGIKKEEIAGNDAFLNSLFNKFDLSGDGVLSRQEIQKMVEMFNALAKNDGELTTAEAKKFQLDGEKIGQKNAREVFTFINKLASTTQGVKSVNMNGTTEVVVLDDGTKEEVFEDGSKRTTKPNGSMVYVDKNGVKLQEVTVQNGKTVNTEYEDGKKVKETITEADKETVVEYKDGEESRKTITTKDTIETFYKKDGRDVRIVEDKNTGLIQTFIGGVLAKEENKRTNTITTYRDGNSTTTTKTDNLETITVKDADGNYISATATQKLEDGRTQVTRTEYDGENTTTTISIDGKNLSQTKVVDGVTYTVNYDGAGNTTVIVQNGESIAALAKKFGCTVEEIISANPDKVKGQGSNKYFLVGAEIKIPREVPADSPALQNRKSASETQADYKAYDARIKAEQAAQAKAVRMETEQAEQKQQRENEKAQARQLAQQFYDIADHNCGIKSMNKMLEFLDSNINSSNIVDFLNAYIDPEIRKKDSSIIDTVVSEVGAGSALNPVAWLNGSKKQKAVLTKIIDTLCQAAREAGVPEADITSLRQSFVDSMNTELNNGMKKTDTTQMEIALDALLGKIAAAKSGVVAQSEEAAMEKVAGDFDAANTQATEEFETAREEDSWIARAGDKICGWFGCNTVEEMRAKLGDNAAKVEKLIEAANNGDKVEFKRIYKELFGVEFDPNLIAASEKANEDYMNAVIAQSQVEKMNTVLSQINDSMSFDEIASVIKNLYANDPDVSPDEVINGILKMYEDAGISAGTEEEKKAILLDFVNSTKAANQSVLDELTATKSIDELAREAELISKSAFGTNDISKMVNEFNQNMVMTDAIGTAAVEIGATVLLQFIPGVGQMAAAKLATSAVRWGVKGTKIAKYATKAGKAFKAVSKLQSGTASTSKVVNAATRIGTQAVGAGVATAGVGASKNEDVKTVLHRALMNMSFAGAGAASNMIAPKLMQVFGISRQVAVELAEEIINAAAAYGITTISGDSYGTQDAFLDIVVGMVMARVGGAGAARGAFKGADIDPNMPKPDVDVTKPQDGGIDWTKAPEIETKFNPDGTTTVSAYEKGRLIGKIEKDVDGNVIKEYKYEYDADGNVTETEVTPQKPVTDEPQSTPKVKTVDEEFETVIGLLDNKVNTGDKLSSQEVEQIKTLISNLDDVDKLKDIQFLLDKTNGSVAKTLSKACKSKLDGLNAKSSTVADEPEVKSETSEDAPVEDVVTPKESKKAERKARANKLKELRAKLGNKLARAYVKIENAIKNMKNAVDFDKISTSIRTKFANFKTEMNELLDRLNAKMRSLRESFGSNQAGDARRADSSSKSNVDGVSGVSRPELDKYKPSRRFKNNLDHSSFVESRSDLFGDSMHDFGFWQGYTPKNQKHGAWKMHLFSVSEADWQTLCDVIIPYLKEHDIDWKTFNSSHTPEMLSGQQSGKAFTIYPRDNEHMAQIAKDLDYIIRRNKLETSNSHIVGDNQMGSTGRLFYRYEFNSGKYKDEILDLANSADYNEYHRRYDSNRGEGRYLADDMSYEDDIWRNFDPSDPNAKYETGVSGAQNRANEYNRNTARAEAYAKFDKNQRSINLKGEGTLSKGAQYALDMNDLPELYLYDGTYLDFSQGELRARIENLAEGDFFTIGRHGDVVVGDGYVSRHHILVTKHNGQIIIKDISSNGGTYARTRASGSAHNNSRANANVSPKANMISVFNKYLSDDMKLSNNATPEEVKKAYRKLSVENHPDKFSTDAEKRQHEEIFKVIASAYDDYVKSIRK